MPHEAEARESNEAEAPSVAEATEGEVEAPRTSETEVAETEAGDASVPPPIQDMPLSQESAQEVQTISSNDTS